MTVSLLTPRSSKGKGQGSCIMESFVEMIVVSEREHNEHGY